MDSQREIQIAFRLHKTIRLANTDSLLFDEVRIKRQD